MRVYVAGPLTQGDVAQNIAVAIRMGDHIARVGHIPYIPHLSFYWHTLKAHDYEFWMKQDFAWIAVCDALLRLPGDSPGADREVSEAQRLGIRVVHSIEELRMP